MTAPRQEPMTQDPLSTMDAKLWAVEFMRIFGERRNEIDESLMISWFANAIMRGHDSLLTRVQELEAQLQVKP